MAAASVHSLSLLPCPETQLSATPSLPALHLTSTSESFVLQSQAQSFREAVADTAVLADPPGEPIPVHMEPLTSLGWRQ